MYDVQNEKSPNFKLQQLSPRTIRPRNRLRILAGFLVCLALFHECFLPQRKVKYPKAVTEDTSCSPSSIANDVLVVVKTSSLKALETLPVHFNTTLSCVPNYVLYLDHEDSVNGHHIYDAVNEISDALKASTPEFKRYESSKPQNGHHKNSTGTVESSQYDSSNTILKKLDRFKFLPMLANALQHQPKAKWFVFIEADTYLVWQNLLEYLSKLDADKDLYIGRHAFIGDVAFAHSASGIVLSRTALQKVSAHWQAHVAEYDKYAANNSAGDTVLGKALSDIDIPLFSAFPHFQSDAVSSLDHNASTGDRRPWCYAAITYSGMRASEIRELWAFEQEWWRRGKGALQHRDVFKEYIVPGLATRVEVWDNLSGEGEHGEVGSVEACFAMCKAEATCLQYSYAVGKCMTSREIRYGSEVDVDCVEYSAVERECLRWQDDSGYDGALQSGWMIERLSQYMEDMDSLCGGGENDMWLL